MPKLIAMWNGVRGVWEKPGGGSLLCEHSALFSESWPSSGMMRDGIVSELLMPEPLIKDSESSSLPTPKSRDWKNQAATVKTAQKTLARGWNNDLAETLALLRTPAASEAERGHQPEEKARARGGQVTLSGQTNFGDDFGRFQPAISRWEQVIGFPAPEPTKADGRDGSPRLSPSFTEWMMGLEPGWITSVGLSRKDELKACGNGVVPQQAKLALRILLEAMNEN